jgi:hypothetical protein
LRSTVLHNFMCRWQNYLLTVVVLVFLSVLLYNPSKYQVISLYVLIVCSTASSVHVVSEAYTHLRGGLEEEALFS